MISRIGFRKSLEIKLMIKTIFLLPSLTKSFLALLGVTTKNAHDPSTWLPIFLRKSSTTIWELFDIEFSEVGGPNLAWDGDDGLGKLWGLYYKRNNMEFILRVKASLRDGFDATATATTISLSITNSSLGTMTTPAMGLTIGLQYKKRDHYRPWGPRVKPPR